jgi:hypothetical protein
LLTVGFLLFVYAATLLAQTQLDEGSAGTMQIGLSIYARVVLLKGLLPQLLLALLLWPLLDRIFSLQRWGKRGLVLGLAASAALALFFVIPGLLMLDFKELPAVKFRSSANLIVSALEMTAAVTVALLLPRRWLP